MTTTGTTGTVTATIKGSQATYTGGSGVDVVTLSGTSVTKAISLGAGDDTLKLATGTQSLTANVDGGDGTDTLAIAAVDAAAASLTSAFGAKISNFEKLDLGASGTDVVNLANLDSISYVISGGATSLELDSFGANGTLELTGASTLVKVVLADATGTSDVLNVVTKVVAADLNFGAVQADGVETINLTVTDTDTSAIAGAGVNEATIKLTDAALKSLVIAGNSDLVLTVDATNTALTTVNASALTGSLTATTGSVASVTITGGSGADTLTAAGNSAVLNGGAGNDTLIVAGDLAKLTGGAGADNFNVAHATTNVNSYATITDLSAGDIITFGTQAVDFNASKVTLADTSVFQDYANAAIAATSQGDVSWFQYNGATYVVDHESTGSTSFVNGTDVIVKITGTVDLSTASFSSDGHTLLLVG
ncbi:hypothetical protein GJ699_21625 [Duganella sp. FT80W]|uniref:Calcium-binding protein n=1 Tax=Duganella guangzhouensis TaxID=2666084 RepID=A0A6I2L6U9_9BURK|nr:hypothetical protein [Duganella guangzhouensis]